MKMKKVTTYNASGSVNQVHEVTEVGFNNSDVVFLYFKEPSKSSHDIVLRMPAVIVEKPIEKEDYLFG